MKNSLCFLVFTLIFSITSLQNSLASEGRSHRSDSRNGGEDSGGGIKRRKNNNFNTSNWRSSVPRTAIFIDLEVDKNFFLIDSNDLCVKANSNNSSKTILLGLSQSKTIENIQSLIIQIENREFFAAHSKSSSEKNLLEQSNQWVQFIKLGQNQVYLRSETNFMKLEICGQSKVLNEVL